MYTQFLTPSLARKKGDKAEGVGVRAGESADYVLYIQCTAHFWSEN
jgi:hypothetical protein